MPSARRTAAARSSSRLTPRLPGTSWSSPARGTSRDRSSARRAKGAVRRRERRPRGASRPPGGAGVNGLPAAAAECGARPGTRRSARARSALGGRRHPPAAPRRPVRGPAGRARRRWSLRRGGARGRRLGRARLRQHAPAGGTVIVADDPLRALGSLARAWRHELGGRVVGVTGSTGKTSTKDILFALLRAQPRAHASPENLNTEVGLPLSLLEARPGRTWWCSRWPCAARARSPSWQPSLSPMPA